MRVEYSNEYLTYMNSEQWRYTRQKRIDLDGGRCVMCGAWTALEVHHLHYKNLGHENIVKDLVTVCADCHKKIHRLYDRQYR